MLFIGNENTPKNGERKETRGAWCEERHAALLPYFFLTVFRATLQLTERLEEPGCVLRANVKTFKTTLDGREGFKF